MEKTKGSFVTLFSPWRPESPAVACGNTVYLATRFLAWEPRVQERRRASDCTGSCQVGRKSDLLPHCTRVRSTTTQTLSSRQEVIIQQPLHPHDSKALQQFALYYTVTYLRASASVSIWPRSLKHWWKTCHFFTSHPHSLRNQYVREIHIIFKVFVFLFFKSNRVFICEN